MVYLADIIVIMRRITWWSSTMQVVRGKVPDYWELTMHTRQHHPFEIEEPTKCSYMTINYGKYIYRLHEESNLLKDDHEIHQRTLNKKISDSLLEDNVPRCDRIFMNTTVYKTHVDLLDCPGK